MSEVVIKRINDEAMNLQLMLTKKYNQQKGVVRMPDNVVNRKKLKKQIMNTVTNAMNALGTKQRKDGNKLGLKRRLEIAKLEEQVKYLHFPKEEILIMKK